MTEPPPTFEVCPGCALITPPSSVPTHAYINASPGCWAVYGEVLARECTDTMLAQAHQLSVDAYAAQHSGGHHPDKSIAVHLWGCT